LFQERSKCYEEFFEILVTEEKALRKLYGPLEEVLNNGTGAVKKLQLVVVRKVNVEQWAARSKEER
jgi:hypothetical protein